MIETYAFVAVFAVQILAMSVAYPARFVRYVRAKAADLPDALFAQLQPTVDGHAALERFLTRYRAANTVIASIGVLLLGWIFGYMRRPDWVEDRVVVLLSVYFPLQISPLLVVGLIGFRHRNIVRRLFLEPKRKAVLQRRGLFDFVSPLTMWLAVASYLLFVAAVIYIQREPFPGLALIGVLTLVYAVEALVVYAKLYGKKSTPFETHAGHVHAIERTVKTCVYACLLCVVFFSFIFAVDLLDQNGWMPFALSLCLVVTTLLCFMGLTAPPRRPDGGSPG